MKKKSAIFFALLFAVTMMFSFGIATTAQANICCKIDPSCPTSAIGHLTATGCTIDWTNDCDQIGIFCQ